MGHILDGGTQLNNQKLNGKNMGRGESSLVENNSLDISSAGLNNFYPQGDSMSPTKNICVEKGSCNSPPNSIDGLHQISLGPGY